MPARVLHGRFGVINGQTQRHQKTQKHHQKVPADPHGTRSAGPEEALVLGIDGVSFPLIQGHFRWDFTVFLQIGLLQPCF